MTHGIIEAIDKNGEIHRFRNGKITEEKERETSEIANGVFCKVWLTDWIEMVDDSELAFLIRIMWYVDHRDNTIRREGEVMTVKEMSESVGREYTRLSRMVNGLVKKGIMGKMSTEMVEYTGRRKIVYTVNPYVSCKGKMLNRKVKEKHVIG